MENKTNEKSKGLGDTIAKVTQILKLDVLAEKVAHAMGEEDCGCNRRREKLNELFPYKKKDENQQ